MASPGIPTPTVYPSPENEWVQQGSGATPGPLQGPAIAYDQAIGAVLLFGGYNLTNRTLSGQTWEYKGDVWTQLTPSTSPSARYDAGMAYDTKDGFLMLYGGVTQYGEANTSSDFSTWEFTAEGDWEELSTGNVGPSPDSLSVNYVALTAGPKGMVLVGTASGSEDLYSWYFSNPDWTEVYANITTAYDESPALTADPATGTLYLWDGNAMYTMAEPTTAKGYAWAGMTGGPPTNVRTQLYSAPLLVFDPNDDEPIYFGTSGSSSSAVEETWLYEDSSWASVDPSSAPQEGFTYAMAGTYDSLDHYTLLFQATTVPLSGVPWHGLDYAYPPPLVIGTTVVSPTSADVGQWVNFTSTASGGYTPYTYNWSVPKATFPCANATDAIFSCVVNASGDPSIRATVTSCIQVELECSPIESSLSGATSLALSPALTLALTPSRTSLDDDQVVNLTAVAGGGTGSSTLDWPAAPAGWSCSSASSVETCKPGPSVSGAVSLSASTRDSNGETVGSTVVLQVNTDPQDLLPGSNVSSTDQGQSMTLLPNVTGGSGPYTYAWSATGLGCTGLASASPTCTTASNGTYPISLAVVDSNGFHATSPTLEFKVYPDPSIAYFAAQYDPVDTNVPDPLHVGIKGGSGVFTYSLVGAPSGCSGSTTSTPVCTLGSPSTNPILFTERIRDSNGESATSAPIDLVIDSPPTATLYENRSVLDENETIQFTTDASGGVSPYSYSYSGLPGGCVSQNTPVLNCTPTINGTFSVTVNVSDSGGGYSGPNTPVAFNVLEDTRLTMLTADLQVEDPPYWSVNETYEGAIVAPILHWSGGDDNYRACTIATGSNLVGISCDKWNATKSAVSVMEFPTPGTFQITMSVDDSSGWNVSVSWNITVFALPTALSESGPKSEDANNPMSFTGNFSGGSTPYDIWFNDSTTITPLCALLATNSTNPACSASLSSLGRNTVEVTVRFALGAGEDGGPSLPIPGEEFANWTVTIVASVSISGFNTSVGSYSSHAGIFSTEVGAQVLLVGSIGGGVPNYTCAYRLASTLLSRGVEASPQCQTYSWTVGTPGTFYLNLTVQDAVGSSSTATIVIFVSAAPALSSLGTIPRYSEEGVTPNLTVVRTGGFGAFSYNWSFAGEGYILTLEPWVLHTWESSGNVSVEVTLVDGQGAHATLGQKIEVYSRPLIGSIKLVDAGSSSELSNGSAATVPTNSTASFYVSMAGVLGPLTWVWKLNGSAVNTSITPDGTVQWSLAMSHPADLDLSLNVTDANGVSTQFDFEIQVHSDFSGPLGITSSDPVLDLGMTARLNLTFQGGTSPFTYTWEVTEGNTTSWTNSTSSGLAVTPGAVGVVHIHAFVTDLLGSLLESNLTLTVYPELKVACAPTYTGVPAPGMGLSFSLGCVSGGAGPYRYDWSIDGFNDTLNSSVFDYSFSTAGTFPVVVDVMDRAGAVVASPVLLLGTYPPLITSVVGQILSVSLGPNQTAVVDYEVTLTTQDPDGMVTGFQWQLEVQPAGPWIAIANRTINFTVTGEPSSALLSFIVEDGEGRESAPYSLTVGLESYWTTPSPNQTSPSQPNPYYQALAQSVPYLVLMLIVLVALIVLLISRRERPGREKAPSPDPARDAILGTLKQVPRMDEEELITGATAESGVPPQKVRETLATLVEERKIGREELDGSVTYFLPELVPPGTVEHPGEDLEHRTAAEAQILGAVGTEEEGMTIAALKEALEGSGITNPEIYRFVSDLLTTGRLVAERGDEPEAMRLRVPDSVTTPEENEDRVECDPGALEDLESQLHEDSPDEEPRPDEE